MTTGARFSAACIVFVFLAGSSGAAAAVLFPEPLHLTRAVEDPLSGKTTVVEEFYLANRVVSIAGDRTVIADYDRGVVTEIDRAEGTYSVTPFAAIAAASASKPMQSIAIQESEERWSVGESTARPARPGTEFFSATPRRRGDIRRLEVGVDRSVALSRDALDVIIGAAYPNERPAEAEVYLRAAGPRRDGRNQPASNASAPAPDQFALPVEESVTYEAGATEIVRRSRVTRIGRELPAVSLLTIPPGARLVELRRTQTRRMLDELDAIPSPDTQR